MLKLKLISSFLVLLFFSFSCSKTVPEITKLEGNVFGTRFHIVVIGDSIPNFETTVDSLFQAVNNSLSTYLTTSAISKINAGDTTVMVDTLFIEVFEKSKRIYRETNGDFDPTIGLLVNAWGFGPGTTISNLNSYKIDSLMQYVGLDKITIRNAKVLKQSPSIYLDFNAIAKGFGADIVGRYLERQGIVNYMVEIGGELRVRGTNANNQFWRIGIEKPNFDGSRSLQTIVGLHDESMATSGNYRKFKIDSITGEKYVHTIDTKTGYTAKRDLLSATVIGEKDCADVDGYATAFMAMGLKRSLEFLKGHPELKVFFLYTDAEGNYNSYKSPSLELLD